MKKLLSIIFFAVITLTACSSNTQHSMSIKPSEFSEETEKVLQVFDDEVEFFDVALSETAKYQALSVWVYQDGAWTEAGKIAGEIDFLNGQIAIRLTNSSYDLYVIDENGHTKYSCPTLETDFDSSLGIGGSRVDSLTAIELNKEIPIWVKIGTDKNSMKVLDISEDFRNYDCNTGIAITLTVSDQIID